jgi:hypothetical protein
MGFCILSSYTCFQQLKLFFNTSVILCCTFLFRKTLLHYTFVLNIDVSLDMCMYLHYNLKIVKFSSLCNKTSVTYGTCIIICVNTQLLCLLWSLFQGLVTTVGNNVFLLNLSLSLDGHKKPHFTHLLFFDACFDEDEEEDVRSCWMTLGTEEDTLIWRRKL